MTADQREPSREPRTLEEAYARLDSHVALLKEGGILHGDTVEMCVFLDVIGLFNAKGTNDFSSPAQQRLHSQVVEDAYAQMDRSRVRFGNSNYLGALSQLNDILDPIFRFLQDGKYIDRFTTDIYFEMSQELNFRRDEILPPRVGNGKPVLSLRPPAPIPPSRRRPGFGQ